MPREGHGGAGLASRGVVTAWELRAPAPVGGDTALRKGGASDSLFCAAQHHQTHGLFKRTQKLRVINKIFQFLKHSLG